jgi:hypothetical protein
LFLQLLRIAVETWLLLVGFKLADLMRHVVALAQQSPPARQIGSAGADGLAQSISVGQQVADFRPLLRSLRQNLEATLLQLLSRRHE